MQKKVSVLFFIIILINLLPHQVSAVTLEGEDMRLGINGYVNGIYNYMSKMAMAEDGTVGTQPDTSTFENNTHLLFNAVKDRLRISLNIEMDNSASVKGGGMDDINSEITGKLGILETFGEYTFTESFRVRIGAFLTPFGIYNQIRYITPLFASIVLPMMYVPPPNYMERVDAEGGHMKPLIPENGNVMFFGRYSGDKSVIDYYFYGGNGTMKSDGRDVNKDKGLGGRIKITLPPNLEIGGSYYIVDDDPVEGRESFYGADIDITVKGLNIQAEYAIEKAAAAQDRFAYYTRLAYPVGRFIPFTGYDYFKDKGEDLLFRRGMNRYSMGTDYIVNSYISLKIEYHYHTIDDDKGFPSNVPDDIQMFRSAAIFIF